MKRVASWHRRRVAFLVAIWLPFCLGQTTPSPQHHGSKLKFRLAGYPRKHNEGRIEIFYQGDWGTICDDDFSLANAHVLCRHLGFTSAIGWTHSAKYGKGIGKIWLDNVQCVGSEKSIDLCKSQGWGNSDCTHDEDAGVVCKDERLPGFVDNDIAEMEVDDNIVEEIRLRPVVAFAKTKTPITEGIVEVRYRDGWGQICDLGWTPKNTHVICGMMGFPYEKKVNKNFYRLFTEKQQNYYHLHSVACTGTEVHLSSCSVKFNRGNSSTSCAGGMPAVVSCVSGPQFAQASGQKKKLKISNTVRLKAGARIGEGRVEVLRHSKWGSVCDERWGLQEASVLCREMGFGSAKEALRGARMGQGFGPIHMNEVQCTGQERSIWNCQYKNVTAESCQHTQDASVRCNIPYMAYENTIRITGGRTRYEGRVEVATTDKNGTQGWGLICGDGWGTLEAMVVCRQLGLGYANHGLQETWYWDSSNVTEMVWSGVRCTGEEMTLNHCRHQKNGSCRRAEARFSAGVICSETAPDLIMNATLVQNTVYIEDRPLHMLYCAAEENCLSKSAANATWPYGHRRLLRFSSQINNVGRADFRPKAGRHSWVWHACHAHYHSMDIFTHYDLLSANGTKVAEGHKASFCLEDSDCNEGVAKRYACADFGDQGITVGCWDLYAHDIDCQWVDITDVKPGHYIFQVVINPNFEVSESDFTNNAMKCNCKYDGHRIWLHNCHLGDAFSEEAERSFEKYPGQLSNRVS